MVTESDIAKLLVDMNCIAESFIMMKLQVHGQFVEAIRGVVQHYFQECPLPILVETPDLC